MATELQDAWVVRVLGVALPHVTGGEEPGMSEDLLQEWASRRETVIGSLTRLENAFRGMDHPRVGEAVDEIRALVSNLTPVPDTMRKVRELRRYLTTDRVVADTAVPNGFGIEARILEELIPVLDRAGP